MNSTEFSNQYTIFSSKLLNSINAKLKTLGRTFKTDSLESRLDLPFIGNDVCELFKLVEIRSTGEFLFLGEDDEVETYDALTVVEIGIFRMSDILNLNEELEKLVNRSSTYNTKFKVIKGSLV